MQEKIKEYTIKTERIGRNIAFMLENNNHKFMVASVMDGDDIQFLVHAWNELVRQGLTQEKYNVWINLIRPFAVEYREYKMLEECV